MKKIFGIVYGLLPRSETDGEAFCVGICNEQNVFEQKSDDDLAKRASVTIEELITEINESLEDIRTDQAVVNGKRVTFTYYGSEDDAEAIACWLNEQEAER